MLLLLADATQAGCAQPARSGLVENGLSAGVVGCFFSTRRRDEPTKGSRAAGGMSAEKKEKRDLMWAGCASRLLARRFRTSALAPAKQQVARRFDKVRRLRRR